MNKNETTPRSPEHIKRLHSFIDRVFDHAKKYPKLTIFAWDSLKGESDEYIKYVESMLGKDESGVNLLLQKVAVLDSERMKRAIASVTISGDSNSDINKISAELEEISKEYNAKIPAATEADAPLTTDDHFIMMDNLRKLAAIRSGGRVSDRTSFDIPFVTFIHYVFE